MKDPSRITIAWQKRSMYVHACANEQVHTFIVVQSNAIDPLNLVVDDGQNR